MFSRRKKKKERQLAQQRAEMDARLRESPQDAALLVQAASIPVFYMLGGAQM